jgi:hypothetical protein
VPETANRGILQGFLDGKRIEIYKAVSEAQNDVKQIA